MGFSLAEVFALLQRHQSYRSQDISWDNIIDLFLVRSSETPSFRASQPLKDSLNTGDDMVNIADHSERMVDSPHDSLSEALDCSEAIIDERVQRLKVSPHMNNKFSPQQQQSPGFDKIVKRIDFAAFSPKQQ